MRDLILLKLGGSLITDKNRPRTPRNDILQRLANEIAASRSASGQPLIIGHGSGSYGHTAAKKYATRNGVNGPDGWRGFAEVWKEARALNQLVIEALLCAGLPVISFPPSASVIACDGQPVQWDLSSLKAALSAGLIPLVQGDVIFDTRRGGTILSTEDIFFFLARHLTPNRILLAGVEQGVWVDFPNCTQLISTITPENFQQISEKIGGSASVDVTGGMLGKVKSMLNLLVDLPELQSFIFSGVKPGVVEKALKGEMEGTCIARAEYITRSVRD